MMFEIMYLRNDQLERLARTFFINQSRQRIGEQLRRVMNIIRNIKQKKPQVDEEAKEFKKSNDPRI